MYRYHCGSVVLGGRVGMLEVVERVDHSLTQDNQGLTKRLSKRLMETTADSPAPTLS
jgi:hypothetical protein